MMEGAGFWDMPRHGYRLETEMLAKKRCPHANTVFYEGTCGLGGTLQLGKKTLIHG